MYNLSHYTIRRSKYTLKDVEMPQLVHCKQNSLADMSLDPHNPGRNIQGMAVACYPRAGKLEKRGSVSHQYKQTGELQAL